MGIQINESLVLSTLNRLGIKNEGHSRNGWLPCLCPYHSTDLINSGVNVKTGAFSCFSCKVPGKNLVKMVMDLRGLSYSEALEFLGVEKEDKFVESLGNRRKRLREDLIEKLSKIKSESFKLEDLDLIDFDPSKYLYTRQRDFDRVFLDKFKVKECKSGWFKDFLIIPIIDKEKGIQTFEARRLKEINYLFDFFQSSDRVEFPEVLKSLKDELEKYCSNKMIVYKKGILYQNGEKIDHEKLLYLLKPKVLYPGNSDQKETLFNREELDLDKDLYISEGTGTLPKLYRFNKNSTCLFGTAGSKNDSQQKLLTKFKKKKILIPNHDVASYSMIWKLSKFVDDIWVLPIKEDDTHKDFSKRLEMDPIKGTEFVLRSMKIFS
jgi:hypothetical protein